MNKILYCLTVVLLLASCTADRDWSNASGKPAGIAPDPSITGEAVLQAYAAPAWGWRGWFAVHTWIAAKRSGQSYYTVYEVIGWRERMGLPVLRIERDAPDRFWFGAQPRLLVDHRGAEASRSASAAQRASTAATR